MQQLYTIPTNQWLSGIQHIERHPDGTVLLFDYCLNLLDTIKIENIINQPNETIYGEEAYVKHGRLYVLYSHKFLYCYDLNERKEHWRVELPNTSQIVKIKNGYMILTNYKAFQLSWVIDLEHGDIVIEKFGSIFFTYQEDVVLVSNYLYNLKTKEQTTLAINLHNGVGYVNPISPYIAYRTYERGMIQNILINYETNESVPLPNGDYMCLTKHYVCIMDAKSRQIMVKNYQGQVLAQIDIIHHIFNPDMHVDIVEKNNLLGIVTDKMTDVWGPIGRNVKAHR